MAIGVTSSRLVGRSMELAQLEAALADAAAGRPGLAFVVGESGVGKSRLVSELQDRAAEQDVRVLSGDCVELGEGELAYAPLVSALRSLVRDGDPVLDQLPGESRAELATLLPGLSAGAGREPLRGRGDQARVFEALLGVLDGLAREQTVLLVIEDLHWADASTRAFLRFLAATMCGEPLLVVATYRPDELHRRHPLRPLLAELERVRALRVDLAGLTRDELRDQLAGILGADPDPALVERLYARSEGNPLFTEELLAAGLDGRGALPPSLAAALALRVERLPADAQEVARVLSASGRLEHFMLEGVSELEPRALRDALREAVAAHVVVASGDRYALRHALLREALYDDLLPGERTDLHRRLATVREAGPPPSAQGAAAIAHHYLAAGDQPAALAAAVRAGRAAMDVQAYREGAALFERALELWSRVPDAAALTGTDEIELLEQAAACHFHADDLSRSVTLARRALSLVDEPAEPRRAARLSGWLHRALWRLLRQEEALAELERGLGLLADDGPSAERAGLLSRKAKALMMQSRYRQSVAVAREALAEQARLDGSGGAFADEVGALNALGVSLMALGDIDDGADALRRALAMARESGFLLDVAMAAANLSESLHLAGHSEEALTVARDARAELAGLPTRQLHLSLLVAVESFDTGAWEEADAALAEVALRHPQGSAELDLRLREAELALARDERDAARRHLDRAAELAVDSREPQFLGPLGALQVELAAREGDLEAARAATDGALDRIEFCSDDALRMAMVSAAGLTAEAGAAQHARDVGDAAAVDAALTRAELLVARVRACAEDGGCLERGYLATAEADYARAIGQDDPALWETAAREWDCLSRPYLAALARWRQGEALVAAGEREDAALAVAAALERAERLGAAWLAAELDSLCARGRLRLHHAGDGAAQVDPDDEEDDDPFGLTPRERQVLALVAAGATNREIGRQLYMAEKTASVHVSRILAKLDVRSRTEAAGVAHRLGLDAVV
jgi:DNA-binding CsgD family transcriptional regulator/tetratricopeptide (TPR) repeat protein